MLLSFFKGEAIIYSKVIMFSSFAYWLATFFGAGLSPKAPGSVGSLASLVIWAPLVLLQISWQAHLATVIIVYVIGLWACQACAHFFSGKDPQAIVIDEVAGQGLALILCPPNIWAIGLGLLLFRFFDISKIWPASYVDKKINGPTGIMLDDIVAGAYAFVLMQLIFLLSDFW